MLKGAVTRPSFVISTKPILSRIWISWWGVISLSGVNLYSLSRQYQQEDNMGILDLAQEDNITARVGDKLKAHVALVTGGTRGIGAAICRSLASQGAKLAAGYTGNDK